MNSEVLIKKYEVINDVIGKLIDHRYDIVNDDGYTETHRENSCIDVNIFIHTNENKSNIQKKLKDE